MKGGDQAGFDVRHVKKFEVQEMICTRFFIAAILLVFQFFDSSEMVLAKRTDNKQNIQSYKRPLTVADMFGLTELYPVQKSPSDDQGKRFLLSDDHQHVFIVTGAGLAEKKTYVFRLLMYNMPLIKSYVNGQATHAPEPYLIAENYYNQGDQSFGYADSHAIKALQTYDSGRRLIFLMLDENSKYQLYSFDTKTRSLVKITNVNSHVRDYQIIQSINKVIFSTAEHAPSAHCQQPHFSAVSMRYSEIICLPDGRSFQDAIMNQQPSNNSPKTVYLASLSSESETVTIAADIELKSTSDIIISSDERRALIIKGYKKLGSTARLANTLNQTGGQNGKKMLIEQIHASNMWEKLAYYREYFIFDLSDGSIQDSGTLPIPFYVSDIETKWNENNHIYVTAKLGQEKGLIVRQADREIIRRSDGGIIYIDISDDNADNAQGLDNTRRADNSQNSSGEQGNIYSVNSNNGISERCRTTLNGNDISDDGKPYCYVESSRYGIRIYVDERIDSPQKISAVDLLTNRSKVILNPNLYLKNFRLGKVEVMSWEDKNNYKWRAGIVYPTNYSREARYPVVIQTHGFDPNIFLMTGPYYAGPPYAAQALANKGILVLQIMNPPGDGTRVTIDQPLLARGVESAIEQLAKRGVIDPKRIGMIGYSGTGQFVMNMTVFPKYKLKAVAISDAVSPSPFAYARYHRIGNAGLIQEEQACGAQPWGARRDEWFSRNLYYHLDNVGAAVLFQDSRAFPFDWWDVFAGLQRLNKPVDYHVFQAGNHPMLRADAVLASQQLTVDWFDFWLNDRRDLELDRNQKEYDSGNVKYWEAMRRNSFAGHSSSDRVPQLSQMDCPPSVEH